MPIEIEKKYRLTPAQRRLIEKRLRNLAARPLPVEFEENTIYRGKGLKPGSRALRLRRVGDHARLTFKRRFQTRSPIKHQEENETGVSDADAMNAILGALGFQPALVYEKRRTRWNVDTVKVVIDELPFGLFMEIEAAEKEIKRIEKMLGAEAFEAVHETYPDLTVRFGRKQKGIIEARFKGSRVRSPTVREG
jgi:adenylate cyclase class 2